MDWSKLITFIDARAAGYAGLVRGATPEQIAELRRLQCPARLPAVYESYLAAFGADDGGFILSEERFTDVPTLLEDLRADEAAEVRPTFPRERYLWIGGQMDERDETYWGDFYLDLAARDREDPPLLTHTFYEPYDASDEPHVFWSRFSEFVQTRAFMDYEENLHTSVLRLSLAVHPRRLPGTWSAVGELLGRCRLRSMLPGGPTLWIGAREGSTVLMSVRYELISLSIVSEDAADGLELAEMIRDNIPADYVRLKAREAP
jgi:hypothetical protein